MKKMIDGVYIDLTQQEISEIERSRAEVIAKIPEIAKQRMREIRNRLLAETDHFAFQDRIMTEEIKTYRQALRDLPKMITPDDSTEPLPAPTIDQQGQLIFLHWPEVPK